MQLYQLFQEKGRTGCGCGCAAWRSPEELTWPAPCGEQRSSICFSLTLSSLALGKGPTRVSISHTLCPWWDHFIATQSLLYMKYNLKYFLKYVKIWTKTSFMKEHLPQHSIFVSIFQFCVLENSGYIKFMMCHWGCEFHSLKTTALVGPLHNEGANQVEMGRPFSSGISALQQEDKRSMGPFWKDRANPNSVTVSPYCLARGTCGKKPAEALPVCESPTGLYESAGGKNGW